MTNWQCDHQNIIHLSVPQFPCLWHARRKTIFLIVFIVIYDCLQVIINGITQETDIWDFPFGSNYGTTRRQHRKKTSFFKSRLHTGQCGAQTHDPEFNTRPEIKNQTTEPPRCPRKKLLYIIKDNCFFFFFGYDTKLQAIKAKID